MTPLAARLRLTTITDDLAEGLLERAEAALRGGATCIQLRLKGVDGRTLHDVASALVARCEAHGALCIVNDRVDVALAARAHGVHLGPHDLPVAAVRAIAPPPFLIGASAGTPEVALRHQRDGADYLGVGAIFDASGSKPDASAPRGLQGLAAVVDAVSIPIVAIGGVDLRSAPSCVEAGAAGVAVIRGVFGQGSPEAVERAAAAFAGALALPASTETNP